MCYATLDQRGRFRAVVAAHVPDQLGVDCGLPRFGFMAVQVSGIASTDDGGELLLRECVGFNRVVVGGFGRCRKWEHDAYPAEIANARVKCASKMFCNLRIC